MTSKIEKASPMNHSFHSPSVFNMSDQFLKVEGGKRSFSPFLINQIKSPNISPIENFGSPLIKKRDPKYVDRKFIAKADKPKNGNLIENSKTRLMNKTLNIKTVLEHLELSKYLDIFNKEEINLDAMFTLSDDDLKSIEINDAQDRQKILDFINCFKTPKKSGKPERNTLHRL